MDYIFTYPRDQFESGKLKSSEVKKLIEKHESELVPNLQKLIDYYMGNAALMREKLTAMGFSVYGGEHAPYLWVKTPGGEPSWRFFDELLYGAGVVCTPGVGFGPSGEGYFRLSAFAQRDDCAEAMRRIKALR